MLKLCYALILLIGVLALGALGQHPCDTHASGDWCFGDGYVSCPGLAVRPCQAGLKCQQTTLVSGVVYCVRPNELTDSGVATPAPTESPTAAATPKPAATQRPTQAPTQGPTPRPTKRPSSSSSGPSTQAPTPAPTQAPTVRPTPAATARPTPAPTQAPTPAPTVAPATPAPTTRPSTAPTTKPPTATVAPGGKWPNGPVKAIYIDNFCWDSTFSFNTLADAGYNLVILAFYVNTVQYDCAIAWAMLGSAKQQEVINYYHSKGARIIVSTGGATDAPYSSRSGAAYATPVAQFANDNFLDGVDFDLENFGTDFKFGAMDTTTTVAWVAEATNTARAILGASKIITHAPQPPYFGNHGWADGYGKINTLCPHIDFYLVQFYNNGPTTTYDTMFKTSGAGASVTEMVNGGIPLNKIVIGKPVHASDIGDTTQGYNTAAQLKAIFAQAKAEMGWNTGVMGWQWIGPQDKDWINTIYPN